MKARLYVRRTKVPRAFKPLYAILWAVIFTVTLTVVVGLMRPKPKPLPPIFQTPALQQVPRKLTQTDVAPGLVPALVFIDRGDVLLPMGMGTYFEASNGRQLLTSAHLFGEKYKGKKVYVQLLRPYNELTSSFGIEGIDPETTVPGYNEFANDYVLLKVGTPKPFDAFYTEARKQKHEKHMSRGTYVNVPGKPQSVTHLLSGEKFPMLGYRTNASGLSEVLIARHSLHGESGAGFVNDKKQLFVLMATIPNDQIAMPRQAFDRHGLTNYNSDFTLVVGSFTMVP